MTIDDHLCRRPATDADTDYARRVHHDAHRDVVIRQFGAWDEHAQDRFFANDWNEASFEILEWDGERCGYVAIENREDDVHVRELVVDPQFQGLGIGTAVVEAALAHARLRGVPATIETLRENRAAQLYRRLGFVEVGHDETHTHFRQAGGASLSAPPDQEAQSAS